MNNTKMTILLAALALCMSSCSARPFSCEWHPSLEFIDVGMKCSGKMVTHPPIMLKRSLKLLLMNDTAISSLDHTTFQNRDLTELTSLSITYGVLASVGENAFCSLPALRKLDLSHNELVLMHDLSLSCNKALTSVSLSNNPSLPHLPRLDSSSVETLYLDYCGLKSVDAAAFEGMPALKTISLLGNPHLNCSYEKKRFKKVLVMCDDSSSDLSSPVYPGDYESTSQNSLNVTDSTVVITENAASGLSKSVSIIALVLLSLVVSMPCL